MREMKDSGIEWIGEIPADWTLQRGKTIFAQRLTKGNQSEILLAATQKYGMLPQSEVEGVVQVKEDADLQQFRTVHKKDFVISLRSFQGGFEYSQYEGVCSPAYQVFYNTNPICHNYYRLLFKSDGFIQKMNSMTVGIREGKNIQYSDFANSLIPVPPINQQQRIADYLDRKCSKIDAIIARQQEVIEKLKAYKLAVITEAVTKGLNPVVPMKDSGIDFIGSIPEAWRICRLRNIGTLQNGISKGGEFFGHGFPFVSYGDVYRNFSLPVQVAGLIDSSDEERRNYSVESGDIFFTRTSETIEEVGFSSVCEETIPDATFAGFLIRVRPFTDDLVPKFAKYYFRSNHHRYYLVKQMNLVTRASLGQDLLKSMPVLVPPKDEQISIAAYLDKKCGAIESSIEYKQRVIERLTAYKKSLIYEVVTGKKEV